MEIVTSKGGVRIRLTDERWFHIVENHDDLAGYYDEVLDRRRSGFDFARVSRGAHRSKGFR
jgi:hypothetical protein